MYIEKVLDLSSAHEKWEQKQSIALIILFSVSSLQL